MPARVLFLASVLIALVVPRSAAAQDAGALDPVAAIEAEIDRAAARLSGEGCPVACQALGSMQRAADRLCALDPGPRCASVRGRVKEAARRVHEECPACRVADEERTPVQASDDQKKDRDKADAAGAKQMNSPPPVAPAPPEPAPQALEVVASKGGSCAGCAIPADDGGALGAGALAFLGLIVLRRRSRRPRL